MIDKTKQCFYKDDFTLRQISGFALAANWAWLRYDNRDEHKKIKHSSESRYSNRDKHKKIKHFSDLMRECFDSKNSFDEEVTDKLEHVRNYFSHYKHEFNITPNEEIWHKLVRNAAQKIAFNEKRKLHDKEETADEIKNILEKAVGEPKSLFCFKNDKQPFLALMLSPFLTRSEMAFLIGKIWFGDTGKEEDRSNRREAQKYVLQKLAIPDSAVHMLSEGKESFLSPKQEQGFAILERLKENVKPSDESVPLDFPNDEWFIRQLLLFLENMEAVPDIVFARSDAEEQDGPRGRSTTRVSDSSRQYPYRIRHNTIEISDKDGKKRGVLGINPLKYLVLAVLRGEPINDFLKENALSFPSVPSRTEADERPSKEKIRARIKFLQEKYEDKPKRLQPQIRFLARTINQTCAENERYLSRDEYKEIENMVRFYRKSDMQTKLEEMNIWNQPPAQSKAKNFHELMQASRLQDVYQKARQSHIEWLDEQNKSLDSMDEDTLLDLAHQIKLRGLPVQNKPEESKPFRRSEGLTVEQIKKDCFHLENKKAFFNFVRELVRQNGIAPEKFGIFLEKEEYKNLNLSRREKKKRLENWARTNLLWEMVRQILQETLSDGDISGFSDLNLADIEVTQEIEQRFKVVCNIKKSWRNYARQPKSGLGKLLNAYYPQGGEISLLDAEAVQTGQSVEALRKKMEQERYTAIRAILLWEKQMTQEHNITPPEGKNYIPFETVLEKSDVNGDDKERAEKYRNTALHNGIGNKPFRECPNFLKAQWETIEREDGRRQQAGRQRGMKKRGQKKRASP